MFCKGRSVIPGPGYPKHGIDVAELFGTTGFSLDCRGFFSSTGKEDAESKREGDKTHVPMEKY